MSKPTDKINRTIRSEQVLEAFVEVVRKNLPLELKHTRITSADIISRSRKCPTLLKLNDIGYMPQAYNGTTEQESYTA